MKLKMLLPLFLLFININFLLGQENPDIKSMDYISLKEIKGRINKENVFDLLSKSSSFVIGKIMSGKIVLIKDGLKESEPIKKDDKEGKYIVYPKNASWFESELLGALPVYALQVDLEIIEDVSGNFKKADVINVNLIYGINDISIQGVIQLFFKNEFVNKNINCSLIINSLDNKTKVYSLTGSPVLIEEVDLNTELENIKIKWARFNAYKKVEIYLSKTDILEDEEFEDLENLVFSKKEGLGKPKLFDVEIVELDKLKLTKDFNKVEMKDKYIKWWAGNKSYYILMPFRKISK